MSGAIIGGSIAAAGALGSGLMGSMAAKSAAKTQANAADYAANLQGELGQESLANENYQYQQAAANDQPFLQSGANGLASLDYLLGVGSPSGGAGGTGTSGSAGSASSPETLSIPGISGSTTLPGVKSLSGTANTNLGAYGSLMDAYPGGSFTAPTAAQAAASPGEQFQQQQGQNAIQSSAAANGSLLTGGTLNAEQQYGQQLASTNYNNVYNQALQGYNTNYNTWANQNANEYNRLASLAGMGQTTAQQLGSTGMQSAGQVANTLNSTGQQMGQNINNAGAATASGYVGSANALGSGLSGATGSLSNMLMLNQMMGGSSANSGAGSGINNMFNLDYMG